MFFSLEKFFPRSKSTFQKRRVAFRKKIRRKNLCFLWKNSFLDVKVLFKKRKVAVKRRALRKKNSGEKIFSLKKSGEKIFNFF